MTIKVLLLLLALVVVSLRARAYEAPCYELGQKKEFRNFGDFGSTVKHSSTCEISRVIPSLYECRQANRGSLIYQWTLTAGTGTSFYVLSVDGVEEGYFYDLDRAMDAFMESGCSDE